MRAVSWGATFLEGFGSELALGARPAEGQEGAEGSLDPTWAGSRTGGETLPSSLRTPGPHLRPVQAHRQLGTSLGCHRCHSLSC